jgi:hypothetical protein
VLLNLQAERVPASKPLAKIKSADDGFFVAVGVGVRVGVFVGVGEGPEVGLFVGVNVGGGVPGEGAVISYILPSVIFGSELLSMPRSTI